MATMGGDPEHDAYANLCQRQKEKLNILFEEIVPKVAVDYDNTEIQDIHRAVDKLLEGGVKRINQRGIFSISRIEPCGSMTEKMAVWRSRRKCLEMVVRDDFLEALPPPDTRKMYLEFDYLAILDGSTETSLQQGCSECFQVPNPPINLQQLKMHHDSSYNSYNSTKNSFRNPSDFDAAFLEELNTCCCCKTGPDTLERVFPLSKPPSADVEHSCDKCTVDMPSGRLQINIAAMEQFVNSIPTYCSLICRWTSKASSSSGRNIDGRISSSSRHQVMNNLEFEVCIDFLPAIQISNSESTVTTSYPFFIVPKQCAYCDPRGWRRSGCLAEINSVLNMSNKHHKCYRIIKYMIGLIKLKLEVLKIKDLIRWYHIKILFLHHSRSCKDLSEDCAKCVLKVFQELLNGYKSKELYSIHSPANLLEMRDTSLHDYKGLANGLSKCITLMCSFSEDDSCETYLEKLSENLLHLLWYK